MLDIGGWHWYVDVSEAVTVFPCFTTNEVIYYKTKLNFINYCIMKLKNIHNKSKEEHNE